MTNIKLLTGVFALMTLLLGGCAGRTDAAVGAAGGAGPDVSAPAPAEEFGAPDWCYTHPVSQFVAGVVACDPKYPDFYAACPFDADNVQTSMRGVPNAVSYVCDCTSGGTYACFGSPGLPPHAPLK